MRIDPWNAVFLVGFVVTQRRVDATEKVPRGRAAPRSCSWRSSFSTGHTRIGRNWSPTLELQEGHTLVTHGVSRAIRHPMYAAILLWDVAQGLMLPNWLAGWGALATFAMLYVVRAPREERMMVDAFGDGYREYMRRTGRLFPHVGYGFERLR